MASTLVEELNSLREELTIEKVILESLKDEDFDGVQQEREAAETRVAELKAKLRTVQRQQQALIQGSQASTATLDVPSTSFTSTSFEQPSFDSTTMDSLSPFTEQSQSSGQQRALPSRKRELTSPTKAGRNKSRRSSPMPPVSQPFQAPVDLFNDDLDIIDLTGDDVDLEASFIADQIKEEQARQQEYEDRKLAEQLSYLNGEAYNPESSFSSSNTEPSNALSRLMATQRANSVVLPSQSSTHDDYSDFSVEGEAEEAADLFQMPGSFPRTNWNARYNMPSQAPQAPQVPGSHNDPRRWQAGQQPVPTYTTFGNIQPPGIPMSNRLGSNNVQVPGAYPPYQQQQQQQPALPSSLLPGQYNPASNGLYVPSIASNSMTQINRPFRHPSMMGYVPSLPTPFGHNVPVHRNLNPLSSIINRTSRFGSGPEYYDLTQDEMPDRLATFLESAYHDPRVTEKELDDLLQNIRPDMDLPEASRGETPEGLKHPLYRHQELALAWMTDMENGTNKGGILADDMGLGKTISTLALILTRKSESRPKTNLIVGPVSLVRQWEEEIKMKTKPSHRLSAFVYHNRKATTEELLKYDVVLTTYSTLAHELKRLETFELENKGRQVDYNDRTVSLKFPLLNPKGPGFYRVILDEAQCIKNKQTLAFKSCRKLRATYRWCLTGTPMMNGILEMYPLLAFLRIKPYCEWEKFRQAFGVLFGRNGDSRHVAMTRLRALLKAVMLRRKKDSQLDGKPILRLPPKTEEIVYAKLSDDERDFYKQLEAKSQVLFSKYLREGSIGKNYSNILVLLLRLRQACCHPHLNLDVEDTTPVTEEDVLKLVKGLDPTIIARIKAIDAFECPICYDAVQSPSFFIPCGHDSCQQCLSRIVDNATAANIQNGSESDGARCPVCRGNFDPRKCFTLEDFRSIHMSETPNGEQKGEASKVEEEESESSDSEDSEDDIFGNDDDTDRQGNLKGFVVNDGDDDVDDDDDDQIKKQLDVKSKSEVSESESKSPMKVPKKKKKKDRKGKKKHGIKPSMLKQLRIEAGKNREAYKKYMKYLRDTWMPAAKVSECMRLLHEIDETAEKTIIFSQWTLLLDLIEIGMVHDGFSHRPKRYDGSMSANLRSQTAKDFRDKKDIRVLLVSLKAGNAGLNLTSATRVIIMDPFWNPYIEMQAVDRAYRIGQQNEVKVYRILTQETVEDRIVALKEKKQEIVEAALDEKESAKIGRLNVNELKFLFNSS